MSEARGDGGRFASLYDAHRAALAAYCRRRVPADAVDDVMAEVFVAAWRRIGEIPAGSELAWLYGVARNVIANQRRGWARRCRLAVRVGSQRSDAATELSVTSLAGDAVVLAALATLPAAEQELLRLRAWEELSSAEIGVALGISSAAVDMRLSRARRRFERALISRGVVASGAGARVAKEGVL